MKNTKKEIEGKMLTDEQATAVRQMIVASMREAYTRNRMLPGVDFEVSANQVASSIIENVQQALVQSNVFEKVVKTTRNTIIPKKLNEQIKKAQNKQVKKDIKSAKKGFPKKAKAMKIKVNYKK